MNDPLAYADNILRLPVIGGRFLIFRDSPQLIKEFVVGTKTLDYGCGPGHSSTFLKSLGLDVDGVDINEHMIKFAKEVDPEGNYFSITSGEIPKSNEYYDLVYAGFVLPYVSTKTELLKILDEIARVLKPGGTFIATVTNENTYKYRNWLAINTDFEENKNIYFWSDQDYCEVISKSGLDIVCTHKPLGKDSDGFDWRDEKEVSPSSIYVAKKKMSD